MKAQDLQFTQLLEGSKQFVIPIFQRAYSWDVKQCEQLWKDIIRIGAEESSPSHFIGCAVYIPETKVDAAIPRWLIIDGQQRIATITLLLIALKRKIEEENLREPVSAAQIEDYYLRNRYGDGESSYRMLLTEGDKETLIHFIENSENTITPVPRIAKNFEYFTGVIKDANLNDLWRGIKKLRIVDVCLQQGIDNPQMIFESMNSTGKALTQADLIRNFVLMNLDHATQTNYYDNYWRPMEKQFGSQNYINKFDEFMRYYLIIHTGKVGIRKDSVYEEFKSYSQQHKVEDLLISLKEYTDYYCRIALGKDADSQLRQAFNDINELIADVSYSMLMKVYEDYEKNGALSRTDFLDILRLVESYVFRRAVCEIPTNSLRQTFATFVRQINKQHYLESVKAIFIQLPSYRRFPTDEEFVRQIQVRNIYNFKRRSYLLSRLENHERKERLSIHDYSIEHIMPQNIESSDAWQGELGPEWQRIHEQYLHTLGNLTLTGYNSEYGNQSFYKKQNMKGGFKESPLRLNEHQKSSKTWGEDNIKHRAHELACKAKEIWLAPNLNSVCLSKYKNLDPVKNHYTINDHPYLSGGFSRQLFEQLRERVLILDDCITEEFLKLYVAYKAETNFVDVVPQANALRLSLNMKFEEIHDPRGLCKDITNLGRWGNGNVEIHFKEPADLDYIIGLVRQSLEKQLSSQSILDM